jgi:hypothetical protein
MLSDHEIEDTALWIASHQETSGEIYWFEGDKADPWNHLHAAMAMLLGGLRDEADAAFRFLVDTQTESGGWAMERRGGAVVDASEDTNQSAYIGTAAWFHFQATRDRRFLVELWPTLERAIDFVVGMQLESGAISWVRSADGRQWDAGLIAGSGSIYGSLVSAERIARELGEERAHWSVARERLGACLRGDLRTFEHSDLPEAAGRYAMDWYYPVLGGALRGEPGRRRLADAFWTERFFAEGMGCRCVADDRKWFTVAESSELVLSLELVGSARRARELFGSLARLRRRDGGYWTGWTMPAGVIWPLEPTTYTAAAVLVANDALARRTRTCTFFHDLGSTDEAAETRREAS